MIVIPLSADEENNKTTGSVVDHMIESNHSIDQSVTVTGRHDVDGETAPDENDGEKILTLDESVNDQQEESNSTNIPTPDLNLASIISDDESSSDLTDDNTELKQDIPAHETNERVNDANSKNEIQEGIETDQDDVERKKDVEMANDNLKNINESETESNDGELSENDDQENNVNSSESESSEKGLDEEPTPKTVFVDYANKSTGALILDKAKNFQGTSNLLLDDKDRYAMIPCNDEKTKYVIIGLSEDILVKSIRLSSFERYSSLTKQFQVLGSQTYPIMTEWEDLGTFEAKPWFKENKEQSFELETPSWARYLKFRFLSHYGDEHYLTVTQIKVHGSTTLQGYHEMQLEMEANQAEDVEELVSEVDTSQENEQPTIVSEKDQFEEVSADTIANEEHHGIRPEDRKNDSAVDLIVEKEVNDDKTSNDEIIQSESENTSVIETTDTINTSVNADHENSGKSHEQASCTMEKVSDESQDERYQDSVESSNNESDSNDIVEHKNPIADSDADDPAEKNDIKEEKTIIEENSVPRKSSDQSDDHTIPNDVEKVKSQKVNTPNVKEAVKSAIETVQKVATIKDAVKEINKSLNSRVKDNDDEQRVTESSISDHDRLADPPQDPVPKTNGGSQEDAVLQDDTDAVISEISYAEKLEDGNVKREDVVRANGTDVPTINSNATETTSPDEPNVETKVNIKPNLNSKTLESIDSPPDAKDLLKHLTSDYSNADCLKKLDFQEFKKKAMKAIQAQKGSTTGATSSIPKNEPIFKKLADEIKVLQTSQGIYEQYIKAVSTCYESLMSKMGEHIKSLEDNQDRRLSSIEEKIQALSKGQVPFATTDDDEHVEYDVYDQEDESFMGRIHSFFVAFIKWTVVVYHLVLDSIRLFLADERVQKGIEIILGYKRDISLVLFGYIFSFLLTKYKTRDENEVISQKNITPNSFTDSKEVRDNHRDSKVPVQMPILHEDTSIIYSFRSDDVSIDGDNEDTNHLNMNTKIRL